MVDYEIITDQENGCFIVKGPFGQDSVPVQIPDDNPLKKQFIDMFLHKADIERGIDFLQCISNDNSLTINEGLFIAGLNNCMKCFKYSRSRVKLDKNQVFCNNKQKFEDFIYFEEMRDKHFDHDENGMLQAVAFLLVDSETEGAFSGPPSVVWNRAVLNYYLCGEKLQEIMQYVRNYITEKIDEIGSQIIEYYKGRPTNELLKWETAQIELASDKVNRK